MAKDIAEYIVEMTAKMVKKEEDETPAFMKVMKLMGDLTQTEKGLLFKMLGSEVAIGDWMTRGEFDEYIKESHGSCPHNAPLEDFEWEKMQDWYKQEDAEFTKLKEELTTRLIENQIIIDREDQDRWEAEQESSEGSDSDSDYEPSEEEEEETEETEDEGEVFSTERGDRDNCNKMMVEAGFKNQEPLTDAEWKTVWGMVNHGFKDTHWDEWFDGRIRNKMRSMRDEDEDTWSLIEYDDDF
jgi:hypothetical protein